MVKNFINRADILWQHVGTRAAAGRSLDATQVRNPVRPIFREARRKANMPRGKVIENRSTKRHCGGQEGPRSRVDASALLVGLSACFTGIPLLQKTRAIGDRPRETPADRQVRAVMTTLNCIRVRCMPVLGPRFFSPF